MNHCPLAISRRTLRVLLFLVCLAVPLVSVIGQQAEGGTAANTSPAAAANPAASSSVGLLNPNMFESSLAALTMLLVIAVLMESAFATIFNWRAFLAYVSVKGVKTPIMIAFAWWVVATLGVDVVASLIAAYKTPAAGPPVPVESISGHLTKFLTAMILAGGSAGIHNLMTTLGFRSKEREAGGPPAPKPDAAWLAIHLTRDKIVGDARVSINDQGPITGTTANPPAPIAGILTGRRPRLRDIFFRNRNRFPANEGHTLKPGNIYEVTVSGVDKSGQPLSTEAERIVLANRAIVDLEVTL